MATTTRGVRAVQDQLGEFEHVEARAFGQEAVDLHTLLRYLRTERGIDALLCEGGAHVYGAMLAARQVDDEFLTLSPILVGNWPSDTGRRGRVSSRAWHSVRSDHQPPDC